MAFHGDGQKFVGDDGFVQRVSFGAEIEGDGATPLPVGIYLIIAVAAVSGFPPSAYGGEDPQVGDVLMVEAGMVIVPAVGDDVVTLVPKDMCDISSWAMEFSKAEIDVTTLCDYVKKYRAGKSDMAGTMNGIFTAGLTDDPDGLLRQFIRIARQDGGGSFDSWDQQESILIGIFYVNYRDDIADKMYVVSPFQLFGMALGAEQGSPQSFSSSFRFANLTYTSVAGVDVAIEPTFYRLGDDSGT